MKTKKEAINAKPAGMNSDWRSTLASSDINDTKMFEAILKKAIEDNFPRWTTQTGAKFSALERDFKEAVR